MAEPGSCGDPTCPCQDGDACHYEAVGGTPAWENPFKPPCLRGDCRDPRVPGSDKCERHTLMDYPVRSH